MSKIKKKRWLSAFLFGIAASLFLVSGLYGIPAQYGLHSRGVKVKLGSRGSDYYGVIREAHNRGIPCVILEHCYLDNANDSAAASTPEQFVQIGISAQDAESGVRYFSYSVNGGVTWSPLQRWAAGGPNASYTVPVPAGTDSVMVRVQNAYDLTADTVVQAG